MRIHTISTYGEFTDQEINQVVEGVCYALRSIKAELDASEGLMIITVKSEETSYRLIGFSVLLNVKIKKLLRRR